MWNAWTVEWRVRGTADQRGNERGGGTWFRVPAEIVGFASLQASGGRPVTWCITDVWLRAVEGGTKKWLDRVLALWVGGSVYFSTVVDHVAATNGHFDHRFVLSVKILNWCDLLLFFIVMLIKIPFHWLLITSINKFNILVILKFFNLELH